MLTKKQHQLLVFIRQRMTAGRDDAISELVAIHRREPEALTLVDIANIVFLLAAGAHETTTALLVIV